MRWLTTLLARSWYRTRTITKQLTADRSGVTAIEYGLILAGVSVLILVTVFAVGNELDGVFQHVRSVLAANAAS